MSDSGRGGSGGGGGCGGCGDGGGDGATTVATAAAAGALGPSMPRVFLQNLELLPSPVPFLGDVDVLRAVFDRVNDLRVLGGRTKAKRAELRDALTRFDDYGCVQAHVFKVSPTAHRVAAEDVGRMAVRIACIDTETPWGSSDWHCRVLVDDWTLWTGISCWRVYDGAPLVNPAMVKWRALRRRLRAWARAATVFCTILTRQSRSCRVSTEYSIIASSTLSNSPLRASYSSEVHQNRRPLSTL